MDKQDRNNKQSRRSPSDRAVELAILNGIEAFNREQEARAKKPSAENGKKGGGKE